MFKCGDRVGCLDGRVGEVVAVSGSEQLAIIRFSDNKITSWLPFNSLIQK